MIQQRSGYTGIFKACNSHSERNNTEMINERMLWKIEKVIHAKRKDTNG